MKTRLIIASAMLAAPITANAQDWRDAAIPAVKQEKKVIDAMFPQPGSLWVSVKNDGSNRDGFADYLCLVLSDSGMASGEFVVIKVWDAAAMARGEMKQLGRSDCQKG